jgi:hypothetical protein
MFAPEALYVAVAILTVAFLIRRRRRASTLPLPPGPRGWPLIDNLFDWPFESAWIPFAEWSKVFGTCSHSSPTGSVYACVCVCESGACCTHART